MAHSNDSGELKRSLESESEVLSKVKRVCQNIGEDAVDVSSFVNFEPFHLKEVLNDDPMHKCTFLLASVGQEGNGPQNAVIILDRKPFSKEYVQSMFTDLNNQCRFKLLSHNDIYGSFDLCLPENLSAAKATIVYPATEKHINKYRQQEVFLVRESASDYQNLTLPTIVQTKFSVEWVYNCLEKKAEADRLLFEDNDTEFGFMLWPDLKWDGKTIENLYVTGICNRRGIKSLRDLNASHLPLLKNMLNRGKAVIEEKYGVRASQLRVYVHYQPSYYHFHVHYTHLKFEAPGSTVPKAHLLAEIIDNIELDGEYYQKKTLYFVTKETDPLFLAYKSQVMPDAVLNGK